MFTLKLLKSLHHVSIIIQIIFRDLICSLLKSLILKFVEKCKTLVWCCGSITFGVCGCVLCGDVCWTFLTNFKISDFNKEHTSSLKMV